MTATVETARDEMFALMRTAWGSRPLVYDDLEENKPTGAEPWARITAKHFSGGQSTIARHGGKSRYARKGTLYINLFSKPGDGLRLLDPLAKIVLDAYEGKTTPSGVWFTKVRLHEQGVVKGYYQIDVLASFSYDEIK